MSFWVRLCAFSALLIAELAGLVVGRLFWRFQYRAKHTLVRAKGGRLFAIRRSQNLDLPVGAAVDAGEVRLPHTVAHVMGDRGKVGCSYADDIIA
jgi:hypothetical protein